VWLDLREEIAGEFESLSGYERLDADLERAASRKRELQRGYSRTHRQRMSAGRARATRASETAKGIRTCPVCSVEFVYLRKTKVCCSDRCSQRRHLPARRAQYRAARAAKRVTEPRTCPTCEVTFVPRQKNKVFCTHRCCTRWHDAAKRGKAPSRWSPEPLPCRKCGVTFMPRDSRHRYCSQRCGWNWQSAKKRAPRVTRVCVDPSCGAEFIGKRGGQIYCTVACSHRYLARRRRNRHELVLDALIERAVHARPAA